MDWFVIAYDVRKNRRRTKLRKKLIALVPSVQKSVLEGPGGSKDLDAVRTAITTTVDLRVDTVRVYHLCASCRERTELFGTAAPVTDDEEDLLVE